MAYYIGQALGLVVAVCSFTCPLWKKKWQMLVNSAVANLLVALNFFLLDELGSGIILNIVAVVQIGFSLWHLKKGTAVSLPENILFLGAYIICGSLGYQTWIDLLPIIGAVIFMFGVFQKNEQKTRLLGIGNAVAWILYDIIIGSSAALGQLVTIIVTVVAMWKYRKKANEQFSN